jgi:hypothetical protein
LYGTELSLKKQTVDFITSGLIHTTAISTRKYRQLPSYVIILPSALVFPSESWVLPIHILNLFSAQTLELSGHILMRALLVVSNLPNQ